MLLGMGETGMGCDIHATIEVKEDYLKHWVGIIKGIEIDRQYCLFTVLANVRNMNKERDQNNVPISNPRGIPEDVSFEFREEQENFGGDSHSISWVTFEELAKHETENTNYKTQYFYRIMGMIARDKGKENVRMVFFFDN